MTTAADSRSRDFLAAFGAVAARGTATTSGGRVIGATDVVAEFIDCCAAVIELVFDDPDGALLLPGVAVDDPAAVLKAYLLFIANEPHGHDGEATVADWYERVAPPVWRLLGFESGAPELLTLELAFSLLGDLDHHAPELRALFLTVRFLAGADLLSAVGS